MTHSFAEIRRPAIDVAIMPIGSYNPWVQSHCTPEQAVEMANAAGARFIVPVHHQTFRLSLEPFREPIERFEAALSKTPERIALREIGQTFVLPPACLAVALAKAGEPRAAHRRSGQNPTASC